MVTAGDGNAHSRRPPLLFLSSLRYIGNGGGGMSLKLHFYVADVAPSPTAVHACTRWYSSVTYHQEALQTSLVGLEHEGRTLPLNHYTLFMGTLFMRSIHTHFFRR
jgi:hypothetical protein